MELFLGDQEPAETTVCVGRTKGLSKGDGKASHAGYGIRGEMSPGVVTGLSTTSEN